MRKEVSACVGCGILPCYHCTEIAYICDWCNEESAELYEFEGDEVCYDCLKKEVNENFEEYVDDLFKKVEE